MSLENLNVYSISIHKFYTVAINSMQGEIKKGTARVQNNDLPRQELVNY